MIGAIIAEFVGARAGIGREMLVAYSRLNTELVFAIVIFVAIVSTIMFQMIVWIENALLRWRPPTTDL
jgi:NitT/TauT family transport system permease protein